MKAENELRDARDRANASEQAIATEFNRYQSQIEHFRNGFHIQFKIKLRFHKKLQTLQRKKFQTAAFKIRIQDMKMIHSRVICQ